LEKSLGRHCGFVYIHLQTYRATAWSGLISNTVSNIRKSGEKKGRSERQKDQARDYETPLWVPTCQSDGSQHSPSC